MRKIILLFVIVIYCLTINLANARVEFSDSSVIKIKKGSVPVIDGKISENEWNDAYELKLTDTTSIYLKYDEYNLYVARNSIIGNVHFIINNRMYVFHASYSLGLAVYEYDEAHKLWVCTKKYHWEMRGSFVRNASESELKEAINTYMMENGWVASTVPMAEETHNEMAISLNSLGINPIKKALAKEALISNILIDHHENYWPVKIEADSPIENVSHGWNPNIIDFDYSGWGSIILH